MLSKGPAMSASGVVLYGFAFGEHLDGVSQRSLGYRLLAPAEPEPWAAEIESLARLLQAAPYPDHWPPTELFCSVLLADGRRLIALARYGLADHTPTHRRSGLELIGIVASDHLGVPTALAIYRWLRQRRSETDDLRALGGRHALSDLVSTTPALPAGGDPVPILPIRLWEHGALLFAATTPSDPDHRLGLLEQEAGGAWQWLPLVGADFPLLTYAQRGPLVAWTPHLAGVALKLDRQPADDTAGPASQRRLLQAVLGVAVLLLLAANFWATFSLYQRLPLGVPLETTVEPSLKPSPPLSNPGDAGRDAFVDALHGLLPSHRGSPEWSPNQLRDTYQQLVKRDERLRVSSPQGQAVVATVSLLSRRNAGRIEAWIRDALKNKGYDTELIELACRRIHEQLAAEVGEAP
jgi:hypothetical protein